MDTRKRHDTESTDESETTGTSFSGRIAPRGHALGALQRVTLAGMGINLALAGFKFAAGMLGNSRAMLGDALHTLSDVASDLAVLIGALFWNRPPDSSHPYGHRRIETLISICMGLGLAAVALSIGWNAVVEMHIGVDAAAPGGIAVVAAVLSILAKEWMYRWTRRVGRRLHSLSLQANAWHHRSDAISSVPVLIAVVGSRLAPGWTFLDRLGALVMALVVLQASWRIMHRALVEILETGASDEVRSEIAALARAVPGVRDVHRIRTRYVGGRLYVDLHVLVYPMMPIQDAHEVSSEVSRRMVRELHGVADVMVHIEPEE